MLRYLQSRIDQLRWQHLKPFERLAWLLLESFGGHSELLPDAVAMGVVEAINKTLL